MTPVGIVRTGMYFCPLMRKPPGFAGLSVAAVETMPAASLIGCAVLLPSSFETSAL